MLKFEKNLQKFCFYVFFFFFCFAKETDWKPDYFDKETCLSYRFRQPKPKCKKLNENSIKGENYPLRLKRNTYAKNKPLQRKEVARQRYKTNPYLPA